MAANAQRIPDYGRGWLRDRRAPFMPGYWQETMNSRFGIKGLAALIALLVLASLGTNAVAAGQLPALRRYRDLKVYSTSSPDKNQPERIVAQTQFVNEGPIPVRIVARLDACQNLSFKGAQFNAAVAPGQSKVWQWSFTAPAQIRQRAIITGSISIN